MAADLQLELRDASSAFTFDVDGSFRIEYEHQYNEAANPPDLRQVAVRWIVTGALLTGATPAALFDRLDALIAATQDRTTTPLRSARLIRDPAGAAVVEQTIGGTGHDGFRLESITAYPPDEDDLRAGQWRSLIRCDVVVASFRLFPDGNGITAWQQRVTNTYGPSGLHVVEWNTRITTAEGAGTTALALARTYGKIPIEDFGGGYVWDTNGPDGIEWEELDADTRGSTDRTPTELNVTSRIKQNGVDAGVPTPGSQPGNRSVTLILETGQNFSRRTTEASAEGPGGEAWVRSQAPAGTLTSTRLEINDALRLYRGTWTIEDTPSASPVDRLTAITSLTGGGRDEEYVITSGGFDPVLVVGPQHPWELRVEGAIAISSEKRPTNAQLPFPPLLPEPWRLKRLESREDPIPRRIGPVEGFPELVRWERRFELAYHAIGDVDAETIAETVFATEGLVETYLIDTAEE